MHTPGANNRLRHRFELRQVAAAGVLHFELEAAGGADAAYGRR
jgi:hypothetical protein